MKRYSTAQIIGKMHIGIRTTSTPVKLAVFKKTKANTYSGMRKETLVPSGWWGCREYIDSATMETGWRHLKKLKKELPFDPAITPLCVNVRSEMKQNLQDTFTLCPLQLFRVYEIEKQPVCLLVNEWIKKRTMECHSARRKKETLLFVSTGIDLEGIMLSEIIQTMLNTVYVKYCTCGI